MKLKDVLKNQNHKKHKHYEKKKLQRRITGCNGYDLYGRRWNCFIVFNVTKLLNLEIMDWKNVNLELQYERDQYILDPLSFEILLLEISCNLQVINKETILQQFEITLQSKISSAREVMNNNLDNILKDARNYRNMK